MWIYSNELIYEFLFELCTCHGKIIYEFIHEFWYEFQAKTPCMLIGLRQLRPGRWPPSLADSALRSLRASSWCSGGQSRAWLRLRPCGPEIRGCQAGNLNWAQAAENSHGSAKIKIHEVSLLCFHWWIRSIFSSWNDIAWIHVSA